MARISNEIMGKLSVYMEYRYSHLTKKEFFETKTQIIKKLKKGSQDVRDKFNKDVDIFLKINKDIIADTERQKKELKEKEIKKQELLSIFLS